MSDNLKEALNEIDDILKVWEEENAHRRETDNSQLLLGELLGLVKGRSALEAVKNRYISKRG